MRYSDTTPMLFVLGCERSASTWTVNIFDSHPATEVLMEPFAPYAGFFPGLPERDCYLTGMDPSRREKVLIGYRNAARSKHPLLWKPARPTVLRQVDDLIIGSLEKGAKALGRSAPLFARRYRLLNMNQAEFDRGDRFEKLSPPRLRVTKELRLNFKIRLLHRLFPDALYIVTIRDPAAQVASILRLMRRGQLTELRSNLPAFFRSVRAAQPLERYHELVKDVKVTSTRLPKPEDLLRWWVINYDVVIRDLASLEANSLVVSHERMSAAPLDMIDELLDFADLPPDPQVTEFVRASSSTPGNPDRPVDTRRHSKSYAEAMVAQADPDLRNKLGAMADLCSLTGAVRSYAAP